MGNGRHEVRIKGFSDDRMERLRRFTRSLNTELALLGEEPLDVLETHQEYQEIIDTYLGVWAELARRLAAERTKVAYREDGEPRDEGVEEFCDIEPVPPDEG